MPLLAAALSSVVCLALLFVLVRRLGHVALDRPNDRSLHERPVPRTGGLAVIAGIATAFALGALELWVPMTLAFLLAALSFLDDLYTLRSSWRLGGHLAAACVVVWYVLSPMHPVEMALLILAVAWITNLYNFMDGSDGLAGGMALIGFAAYALAAWLANEMALAALAVGIAAAAGAFLLFNFHPARIFLGDVGSIPLGFLAAALGLLGWRNDAWPLWFPLVVFGPFIGDATLTLVKRVIRGERVWRAHREHYYQRMIRMGLGHRATAYIEYAAMALCAGAALLGRGQPPLVQAAVFCAVTLGLAGIAVWVDARWARYSRAERAIA
jgi:UDP-N-acetylmuramyl pentapeptide phosphotransferase/UDP-N-acetylglucosamine-1-phosphate transferase